MARIVVYDPSDGVVADRVTEFNPSAHGPDYSGESNKLENPDLSSLWTAPDTFIVPLKYWKRSGSAVVEMSAGEKTAVDDDAQCQKDPVLGRVKNESGGTFTVGTPVYISGFDASSGVPEIDAADADSATTTPAVGVVADDILDGAYGNVIRVGFVTNINTTGSSLNDLVYVASGGGVTVTAPGEDKIHQRLGVVSKVGTEGEIAIDMHDPSDAQWVAGVLVDDSGKSDNKSLVYDQATGTIKYKDIVGATGDPDVKFAESTGESSTGSTSYTNKVSLSYSALAGQTYILMWSFEHHSTEASTKIYVQIEQDDTTLLGVCYTHADPINTSGWAQSSGHEVITAAGGAMQFDMDFKTQQSSKTVKIRRARLMLLKVDATNHEHNDTESDSSTSSMIYQQKARLTFTAEAGDYWVHWYAEVRSTDSASRCATRVQVDDTNTCHEADWHPDTGAQAGYGMVSGFRQVTLTAASHNIDFDFATTVSAKTVHCRRCRVTALKVGTLT